MFGILITIVKTIIMLGILVIIHEGGHFAVAKLCKIKVNEFSVGFGKCIWNKTYKDTKYSLRIIPLGGYVNMEGEEEYSEQEGSFSKASFLKKLAVVLAGPLVNIIVGLLIYFILVCTMHGVQIAMASTLRFCKSLFDSVAILFTGKASINDLAGPVGIATIVSQTSGITDFVYLLSVVSLSLGITNLLPIPPLDGGKLLIYIIEAIKREPLKEDFSLKIQMLGFAFILGLSIFVMYNDIVRII